MPVPVPFGQFVQADSVVHRLDARAKLGISLAAAVCLFTVHTWLGLVLSSAFIAAAIASSRVPLRLAARGLRPILWLLAFTIVINALFPSEQSGSVLAMGPLNVDIDGLQRGLFFGFRIVLLVVGTSLVTLTTSPVALTDALAQLMRPLARVRFPVDDAAMMVSIALRFMPTTAEEAERIIVAQTARGARFDFGGPLKRARAWLPVLVPLFVRLFRRADDLAVAMEARCYRGQGRTRLRDPRMQPVDWGMLVVGMAWFAAVSILL